MTARARSEIALIGVTLVWGASFVLVKNTLDLVSTWIFLTARFAVAAVALLIYFRRRLDFRGKVSRLWLRGGVWAGLCLAAGYCFQTFGLRYTTPSKSAFITGLTSALVPFLALLVYRRTPQRSEIIGVSLATLGLSFLTMPPGAWGLSYGDAITLCCTIGFAGHILVLGRFSKLASFELLSFTQVTIATMICGLMAQWAERPVITLHPRLAGAIVFTGVLCTALPFTVQSWAQQYTTATRTALIFAFEPVSAMITSYIVEGEMLSSRGWFGALLILAGVLAVELKPLPDAKHPL